MGTRYAAVGALLLAAGFTVYATFYAATTAPAPQAGGTMGQGLVPPVRGLYRGKEVTFIHTEASDPQVAQMLTQMTGRRVLTVPSLARVPQALLADVYVFTNGIKGAGPFGFQVDVFDSVPGQPRYTLLRAVVLVTWKAGTTARLLGSVHEIQAAAGKGDVTLQRPGVVVNMPLLAWPGGRR